MKRFFRVVDSLIDPRLRMVASTDELRILRLIGGVNAINFLELVGFVLAMGHKMPSSATVAMVGILASLVFIGIRLRFFATRRGAGTLLWLGMLLLVAHAALYENGQWSFMSPVLGTIVLLAMFLGGQRAAVVALGLALGLLGVITAIHANGWRLPSSSPELDPLVPTAVTSGLCLICLTFLAWLNHSSRQRAYEELNHALERVKASEIARARAEAELALAQKLEAVGRLAAGVAHEINTPVQFVGDSMAFIEEAFGELRAVLAGYAELEAAAKRGEPLSALLERAAKIREEHDLDYVIEEAPPALARSREGLARIARIVRSMRDFAHPDSQQPEFVDLNRAVETTVTIATSEHKLVADVDLQLGDVGRVKCIGGEINQVILNLVVNAAHAIADRYRGQNRRGRITVKTWRAGGDAFISVTDDGGGIPEAVRSRIFEPFFTTKEVGRGTGQGLAIARNVVMNKHHGSLTFETQLGVGTTFTVRLPADDGAPRLAA